jgi:predicted alpha/beta hydrolase family esterase
VNAGKYGHIISASGLADWPLGRRILAELAGIADVPGTG